MTELSQAEDAFTEVGALDVDCLDQVELLELHRALLRRVEHGDAELPALGVGRERGLEVGQRGKSLSH